MEYFLDLLPFSNMSRLELGFWSFPILLCLILIRAPIGLAMLLCGFGGWYFAMNGNPTPLLAKLKSENLLNLFQLFVDYHSNVLADGAVCDVVRDVDCTFQSRRELSGTPKRWCRYGCCRCVRRFRSNLRLIFSYRGYYEPCGITRAETLWVFGWFFQCDFGCWWHFGYSNSPPQ